MAAKQQPTLTPTKPNLAYVGIDCGGTKTTISIFRHDGILLFESKYLQQSQYCRFSHVRDFCEHIHLFLELVQHQMLVKVAKPFIFVSLTVAGINTKATERLVTKTYREMYPHDANEVTFSHDSFGAAYSVFPQEPKCLVLISGTGSGAYFVSNREVLMRRGGHGYLIDDQGSGFDIANTAFKLLTQYFEALSNYEYVQKVDSSVTLHEYINKNTGYTYDDLKQLLEVVNAVKKIETIEDIYNIYYPCTDPSAISSFTHAISSAAKASVIVCVKLLRESACKLASMVLDLLPAYVKDSSHNDYVHKRCVVNLVCFGSLLNNFNLMKYDFFKQLNKYPDPDSLYLRMICVNDIGSYGAALYGLLQYRDRFEEDIEAPKVKPRETIEVFSGPLSKSPRFP